MPLSRTCLWKLRWNSDPFTVWIVSTWKGSVITQSSTNWIASPPADYSNSTYAFRAQIDGMCLQTGAFPGHFGSRTGRIVP